MVDIVRHTNAHGHTVQVVDGGHDIFHSDVVGDQVGHAFLDGGLPVAVGAQLFQHFLQSVEADLFLDAVLGGVEIHEAGHVHHAVGEDDHIGVAHLDNGSVDAALGQVVGLSTGNKVAGHDQNLAGQRIGNWLRGLLTGQPGPDVQLLIELIAADLTHIVAMGVEQQALQVCHSGLHRRRLTWTQTAVDLQQGILPGLTGILLDGGQDSLVLAEHLLDLLVGLNAQGTDQAGDGNFPILINADPENIGVVGLVLQPCAAVRDYRSGVGVLVSLVHGVAVVHAGRTDDLGDNDALSAIDHEVAAIGHHRQVAHEDVLFGNDFRLGVAQANPHLDGLCVGGIPFLAFLDGILGLVFHGVVQEAQLQFTGEIRNGAHVLENLPQTFLQEPLVGVLLDLQHVGDFQDFFILRVGFTHGLAEHNVLDHCHMDHHSLSSECVLLIRSGWLSISPNYPLDSRPFL